jgi:murein DD-endopeptidase MepM/ murein hydrolase activator NlpD
MRWNALALVLSLACSCNDARTARGVPRADGFDFPVGAPDGRGFHDAQPFGENQHLGGDWNGDLGGNSDLGAPVTSIAGGVVTFAADLGGGWGNVVRIAHRVDDHQVVESLYAHLERIDVGVGERVQRGQRIGTVGTAWGRYSAHLHLELRDRPGRPLGGGYGTPDGQLDPTAFIRAHRPRGR